MRIVHILTRLVQRRLPIHSRQVGGRTSSPAQDLLNSRIQSSLDSRLGGLTGYGIVGTSGNARRIGVWQSPGCGSQNLQEDGKDKKAA